MRRRKVTTLPFCDRLVDQEVKWLPPYDSNVPSSVNSGAPSPRWLDGNMMVEQRRVELRTSILQGSTAARCLPRNGAQSWFRTNLLGSSNRCFHQISFLGVCRGPAESNRYH